MMLLILLLLPNLRITIPNPHIRLRLRHQRIPNILLTPRHPPIEALLAQRPQRHIQIAPKELGYVGPRVAHDVVDVGLELLAEGFEREVVDVFAEGVFDLAADGGDAEDDVGGEDGTRDGDPAEVVPHLEGEHHDVDPGDLGDGDGVGDGEGGVEDALDADEDVVEGDDGGDWGVLAGAKGDI